MGISEFGRRLLRVKWQWLGLLAGGWLVTGCSHLGFSAGEQKLATMRKSVVKEPDQIALMLPLHGEWATTSRAIRDGFLAAYYQIRPNRPNLKVKVVDTAQQDIRKLYQELVTEGNEVIVGPLTKGEVESLLTVEQLTVPTLALNTLDDYSQHFAANLYQFGLLPQDEATQAATKMMRYGLDRCIVIMPEGGWGDKVMNAFRGRLSDLGGEVVAMLRYSRTQNWSEQICGLLFGDNQAICQGGKQVEGSDGSAPPQPQRRFDFNGIFLVANPDQARQIVPLLKFYYAGDLPIYTIATVYGGAANADWERDLDGVYFCDVPWVIRDAQFFSGELRALHQQFPRSQKVQSARLQALGVDAFRIAAHLDNFIVQAEQAGVEGASGRLYLDRFNHIYRELPWAKLDGGAPRAVD